VLLDRKTAPSESLFFGEFCASGFGLSECSILKKQLCVWRSFAILVFHQQSSGHTHFSWSLGIIQIN
jgi:hypothetical protein